MIFLTRDRMAEYVFLVRQHSRNMLMIIIVRVQARWKDQLAVPRNNLARGSLKTCDNTPLQLRQKNDVSLVVCTHEYVTKRYNTKYESIFSLYEISRPFFVQRNAKRMH